MYQFFLAEKGQYFEIKNIITPVNILCFLWLNNINQEEKKEKKKQPWKEWSAYFLWTHIPL